MRTSLTLGLAAFLVFAATAADSGQDENKRVALKLTFADGSQVRVTEVEGGTAEVKRDGPDGFHLGLIPTYTGRVIRVQIINMADGNRKPIARFTGPLGETMKMWLSGKSPDPPTLQITAEKVY